MLIDVLFILSEVGSKYLNRVGLLLSQRNIPPCPPASVPAFIVAPTVIPLKRWLIVVSILMTHFPDDRQAKMQAPAEPFATLCATLREPRWRALEPDRQSLLPIRRSRDDGRSVPGCFIRSGSVGAVFQPAPCSAAASQAGGVMPRAPWLVSRAPDHRLLPLARVLSGGTRSVHGHGIRSGSVGDVFPPAPRDAATS